MHDSFHDSASELRRKLDQIYDAIIVVAGSPNFNDYDLFVDCLEQRLLRDDLLSYGLVTFVSGDSSQGADVMINRWCQDNGFPRAVLPAVRSLGRSATYAHNAQLVRVGTHLITFWDGESRETRDLIMQANKSSLIRTINLVDPDPDWAERTRNKPWQEIVKPQRQSFWSTSRS